MVTVIKIGGSILGEGVNPSILNDIRKEYIGGGLIIVHGGGDEVTRMAEELGKKQVFVISPGGIRSRHTDRETVDIYTMVMVGKINQKIVSTLWGAGIRSVGLSGFDGGLLKAQRKKRLISLDENGRRRLIDGGYTGKITEVNGSFLMLLLKEGYLPVVSPVAFSEEFEPLNIDGDRAAASIAGSVKAEKVIFLTNVPGVLLEDRLVRDVNIREAKIMLPKMGFGMEKKVLASIEAIEMGAKESIISSGKVDNPIESASLHKGCTVIYDG